MGIGRLEAGDFWEDNGEMASVVGWVGRGFFHAFFSISFFVFFLCTNFSVRSRARAPFLGGGFVFAFFSCWLFGYMPPALLLLYGR